MVALKICSIGSREKGRAGNNRPAYNGAGEYERKDKGERKRGAGRRDGKGQDGDSAGMQQK